MSDKAVAIVTGGAGFIGSHMVDLLLEQGYHVRAIDSLVGGREENVQHHAEKKEFSLYVLDIRNLQPNDTIFKDVRYVFHFAGIGDIVPSIERPSEYMDVNIQGTVRVLEAARAAGAKKFIYAASSSCYGIASTPTHEDHEIAPQYPYALSKFLGERSAFHWHEIYDLPVNSIRIFNAFGTRSRTSGAYGAVFGVFLKQKLSGAPFTVVGDGTQTRDFLYVTDIARAFLAAAETTLAGRTYNLGAGNPQSVNRLVELLNGEVVNIAKRPGEPDCTWADITRITTELGWKPEVSFEEGVQLVLENIDYWRDAPLWEPESIANATETWFEFLSEK
jgi:UDP-glucose 4-epimerase